MWLTENVHWKVQIITWGAAFPPQYSNRLFAKNSYAFPFFFLPAPWKRQVFFYAYEKSETQRVNKSQNQAFQLWSFQLLFQYFLSSLMLFFLVPWITSGFVFSTWAYAI